MAIVSVSRVERYIITSTSDLANLPTNVPVGSIAEIPSTGAKYTLDATKTWASAPSEQSVAGDVAAIKADLAAVKTDVSTIKAQLIDFGITITQGEDTTLTVTPHRFYYTAPVSGFDNYETGDRAAAGTVLKITASATAGMTLSVTVNGEALVLDGGVGYFMVEDADVAIVSSAA